LVQRFFDDLQRKVALFGWSEGGFLDATGIENGQKWERVLAGALGQTRILVPLCSPNYFRSTYCGREWSVFESRYNLLPEDARATQRYVLPVQWVPTPDLPKRAADTQSMHQSYPDVYKAEGLCYLMDTPRYDSEYQQFLHTFSKDLARAADAAGRHRVWPVPALSSVIPAFPSQSAESPTETSTDAPLHAVGQAPQTQEQPRWYERFEAMRLFRIGLIVWFAANVLSVLGSSGAVVSAVHDRYGLDFLHFTQSVMSGVVTAGCGVGYALPFAAFVLWMRRLRLHSTTRMLCIAVVFLIAAIAVTANVRYSSHQTGLATVASGEMRDTLDSFTNQIMLRQQKAGPAEGSFLFSPDLTEKREHYWTNAQCITAVLAAMRYNSEYRKYGGSIRSALEKLEQSRAGDGWQYWGDSTATVTEVTAWAAIAEALALNPEVIRDVAPDPAYQATVLRRVERDADVLIKRQDRTGGWGPIPDPKYLASNLRTYSTVMALWALLEAREVPGLGPSRYDVHIDEGVKWLLNQYDPELMWVPKPSRKNQVEGFPGLSAQTLYVLYRAVDQFPSYVDHDVLVRAKQKFLSEHTNMQQRISDNQRTHDSETKLDDIAFSVEPSTFLWYPWTYALLSCMAADPKLSESSRSRAEATLIDLGLRSQELSHKVKSEFMYVRAENTYSLAVSLERPKSHSPQ